MFAPGKIRCRIIEVPVEFLSPLGRINQRLTSDYTKLIPKPSELVPWADPTIAGLVAKLQREVRHERQVEWQAIEVVDDKDISLYSRELADFELDAADVFAPATSEAEWPWFSEDYDDRLDNGGSDNDRTRDWDDGSGDIPALV